MNDHLKKLLNADPQQTIATRGFFANYPINEFHIHGNSTIIFGKSDHMWAHLLSSSNHELHHLLENFHDLTNYYYSVENWMVPIILKYGETDWIMKTKRYILTDTIKIHALKENIISLNKSWSDFIFTHSDYKKYTSIDYIKDRLQREFSAGLLKNDQLVAWGFTHDDGALGFLHVLPDYRKQGLGEQVLLSLVQQRRVKNQPVFCNIVPGNLPSINLVKKLGFEFDRIMSWVKLK